LTSSFLLAPLLAVQGPTVPKSEVFPIETLTVEEQALAEEWLTAILDREGLYTVIGGIKPMSSGWMRVDTRKGLTSVEVEQAQRIVSRLRVGTLITSSVIPFARLLGEKRALEGYVFHRSAFSEAVARRQRLFSVYGITPGMPPAEAVLAFDSDETTDRFRAYGHLFGYPDYAVDFFASASETQRADPERKLVPRRFLSIPTYRLPSNGFVYAVPADHVERQEDLALRETALPVYESYKKRRAKFIGPKGRGAVNLVRDWMCRSDQECSPEIALEKARQDR
jgi:hypothetical protein